MEDSPYARVSEDRIPMLRKERGAQAEDLSQSLFFGFNSVLNVRDPRIDAGAVPPEPVGPGVEQSSDAFFWSSNPNHSLLLINDLKHKGQVYIDDVSSNSIAWDKLLRRWLVASLLLPLYILFSLRSPAVGPLSQPHGPQLSASRVYRLAIFVVGTLYYMLLFGSSLVYFVWTPLGVTLTEVLLPLALHFFCFFVEALLCSIELSSVESFDEAADRIMCRMQVSGTSYAYQTVEPSFSLPGEDMDGAGEDRHEDDDDDDAHRPSDSRAPDPPEKENIVAPTGAPLARGHALLKDLVNLILSRQEAAGHTESRWMMLLTLVCSVMYAVLPAVMRLALPAAYMPGQPSAAFWIVTVSAMFTNFVICAVSLDALSKSVAQLKFRVGIAKSFTQLTSKTAASSLGLFHFELQTIENLWGWLTLRSYLLRRGKRPQARVEVILSSSFAFLVPLSLILALDLLLFSNSKTPVSVFVVSSFFFCFVVASYLLLCVWSGVQIQAIFRDPDVLLSEQLAIHYRICTTRDMELHHRLNNLHKAVGKIIEILAKSAGSGVVLSILGFAINENFSRVLVGGLLSLASAGFSSILRNVVTTP